MCLSGENLKNKIEIEIKREFLRSEIQHPSSYYT